ncbi:hypothetical protein PRIC2_011029 [Phytophthora ramorum]
MARTRQQEPGADWSCPLCTLLNAAADDHCAACDNARPPLHQLRNPQPPEPPATATTASSVQHVYRPAVGVFFSSSVKPQGSSGSAATWRQEPRLTVNRRRGNRRQEATLELENKQESARTETGDAKQVTASIGTLRAVTAALKTTDAVEGSADAVDHWVETGKQEKLDEVEEEEEEEDTAMDVEEPCFNLLGMGASVFDAPVTDDTTEDQCTTDETKSREEGEEVDADDGDVVVVSSPARYPGFMPASKVRIDEPAIEKKLACAGLDLSDTDDEEEKPKHLRRQKEDSWEDKWVCQLCTNLNDQTALECSSCMCKRYKDTTRPSEMDTSSKWACHICTNLNPPELTECEACMTNRRSDTRPSNSSSDERWRCSLCTKFNAPGTTQCESCESTQMDKPRKAPGKSRECPVCTNFNAPGSTRCDLCDSSLQSEEVLDNHFVDLYSSPVLSPARTSSYNFDESELENPYADLSQYDDYAPFNEAADAETDFVDEISDNEVAMPLHNPRPVNVRADLKEFKHFVCMEDLQGDYGCRINYNKMFAGQRSHKSYADRLAARQTQSRKRKRDAVRKKSSEPATSASRGGKAARGSKKRKTAAAPRRASAGTKTTKAKRSRKKTAPVRRASSATFASGINHYDDTAGADLGEDISTMAWEGVGSAGYH